MFWSRRWTASIASSVTAAPPIAFPVAFIDVEGYWPKFVEFAHHAEREGMTALAGRDTFRVYGTIWRYLGDRDG